jgi:hypothetical protein
MAVAWHVPRAGGAEVQAVLAGRSAQQAAPWEQGFVQAAEAAAEET